MMGTVDRIKCPWLWGAHSLQIVPCISSYMVAISMVTNGSQEWKSSPALRENAISVPCKQAFPGSFMNVYSAIMTALILGVSKEKFHRSKINYNFPKVLRVLRVYFDFFFWSFICHINKYKFLFVSVTGIHKKSGSVLSRGYFEMTSLKLEVVSSFTFTVGRLGRHSKDRLSSWRTL